MFRSGGTAPTATIRIVGATTSSATTAWFTEVEIGSCRLPHISSSGRNAMAKGQMRSNKEKKKPKAEWNKKKKSGPALSPFALAREQIQPGQNPFGKKN
jgi:hypothetical protein